MTIDNLWKGVRGLIIPFKQQTKEYPALTKNELYAGILESRIFRDLLPAAKVKYKDSMTGELNNAPDSMNSAIYENAIAGALNYLNREYPGSVPTGKNAARLTIDAILEALREIPEKEIASKAKEFSDLNATEEDYIQASRSYTAARKEEQSYVPS